MLSKFKSHFPLSAEEKSGFFPTQATISMIKLLRWENINRLEE
jgi:hypothetical protein